MFGATIHSAPEAVRSVLFDVAAVLVRQGVAADDAGQIELVLAEVLNNIVEHAYAERLGGRIEITLERAADRLWCRVSDSGAPMPGGRPPPAAASAIPDGVTDLPEGGFGWFLIHNLADDLSYAREEGMNTLRFSIPFPTAAPASRASSRPAKG